MTLFSLTSSKDFIVDLKDIMNIEKNSDFVDKTNEDELIFVNVDNDVQMIYDNK